MGDGLSVIFSDRTNACEHFTKCTRSNSLEENGLPKSWNKWMD